MTYCVGIRLDAGLVFLSDSRTNAGVDQVGTFRKMSVFENPGERVMVLMTAGNLSISQSIRELLADFQDERGNNIWNAPNMYEAARILGETVRRVHQRDAKALAEFGIDFNVSLMFGGQIGGERCRLFQIYSAGNFIEAHDENTYFQIGEAKYGKPILDRVVNPATSLDDAAKCALISMDSTLRSNVSVGLPLDLLVYENNRLAISRFVTIDEKNQYFQTIRHNWGDQLKAVFEGIAAPVWDAEQAPAGGARQHQVHNLPVLVRDPLRTSTPDAALQSFAGQQPRRS
ncbi:MULTISPECIES: proteasome-type protease [unclassified Undibacterium]|uniref:proteasome-type protease n=1 Tax=unclassified Undibacterium TaxID=2630295 RepID=UPI002AC9ECE1|nr:MULTISPECIES: proteasome-type protease [unclassified Undibacterium]MEB0140529.1 proteasome-type protease [Undibacterium sp. CCC2.1]MEB0171803.1 proteasome-type protease [Undibacterium sp. CCC1.1]MEB0175619.1 proteasome-type protease [Undibacterium sp. CCC3.4]MEB0216727.1 proteasome-type protease [Undibacterium sp. 5I2]WPX44094.1 proteasome-type protease [Undibacterium sp. CCC3.4]